MDETGDDLNGEYPINSGDTFLASRITAHGEPSSSNAVSKHKKAVDNCVPWRFCLSQLQRCKDPKNRAQFKKLIGKYSQTHFQQRKAEAISKGKQLWGNLEEKYGNLADNWMNIEADLLAREGFPHASVNILVKADPSTGMPCRAVKRINGICRSHAEHNIKEVKDSRTRLNRMPRTVPLLIPKYSLDDYIAFAPPRREIAFVELNDNVKEEYLRDFCCARGKRELAYLHIYKHPTTGGHLGMALAEFKTTQQAMDFYEQCGPSPMIMGFSSKIFVDTLGFWITDEYERLTGSKPATLPPRRSFFKKEEEIVRIRQLIRQQNLKDDVLDNSKEVSALPVPQDEANANALKPAGARTPVGMPNSSSASANSSSRSISRESTVVADRKTETRQRNSRSPGNSESNSITNGHTRRQRSRSPSRSRYTKDHRYHNGHSYSSTRRRDSHDFGHYRDRVQDNRRRFSFKNDRRGRKYRRRERSISPDRTRPSYRASRKRSVSSSSTRSGSSSSYKPKPKRSYQARERSPSQTRRSDSQGEKLSEVGQAADAINLCVQPPPAPYDLSLPFVASYPPPFFPHLYALPVPEPPVAPNYIDSIPIIPEDAPVIVKSVERELGPFCVMSNDQLSELLRQMRLSGHYDQRGLFIVPTLRLYEEPFCSFLVTDFFVEIDKANELAPINPQISEVERIKERLKKDLLLSLKASMCQKIETLMYKEVDRLHVEYETKQKLLDQERSKMKRPETKQIFDFEEQFSNSGMGTRSVFGSNRMWQLNRNILTTKKIPKKQVDTKPDKHVHKKSADIKDVKKKSRTELDGKSRSSSYRSPSPVRRSQSRLSSTSSAKRSHSRSSLSSVSRQSSSSSSSSDLSSDLSENEGVSKKKATDAGAVVSGSSTSAASSRASSPKLAKAGLSENNELERLQITQSRTMRKIDYCEDDSSETEAGGSDWAEEFGVRNETKKGATKKHKHRKPKVQEEANCVSSDEEVAKSKKRPKKTKPRKATAAVEEETTELPVEKAPSPVEEAKPVVEESISAPKSPVVEETALPLPTVVPEVKKDPVEEFCVQPSLEVDVKPPEISLPRPKAVKPVGLKALKTYENAWQPAAKPPQRYVQRYPHLKFNLRTADEEVRILHDFMDDEDAFFVMQAAQNKKISIVQSSANEPVKRPIVFCNPFATVADTTTALPSSKVLKNGNQRRNSAYAEPVCAGACEGAARLIPYGQSKSRSKSEKPSSVNYGFIEVTPKDELAARNKQEKRRELRKLQRDLVSTVGDSAFVRQNVFKFREKMLKFARSGIHGWGLFTLEDIQPQDMIIEYVGEVIRPTVADAREFNYTRRGIGSSYLFRMDDDSVVDATGKGNVARFINHSCNPNCFARVIGREQRAICIYAKRFIRRGEEVTYDYQFPIEDNKIPCCCGAPNCRLYLN